MSSRESKNASYTYHQTVWESLPWYINGTLENGELERVEKHAANCVTCRSELNYLRQLGSLVHGSEDYVPSPSRGLKTVLARIDRGQTSSETPPARFWKAFRSTSVVLRGTLLAQAALIIILLSFLVLPSRPPQLEAPFRTLSDDATTQPTSSTLIRIVFNERSQEREIRDVLRSVGGEIVGGPSPTGVYTLEVGVSDGSVLDPTAIAEELRKNGIVRFAEPVTRDRHEDH